MHTGPLPPRWQTVGRAGGITRPACPATVMQGRLEMTITGHTALCLVLLLLVLAPALAGPLPAGLPGAPAGVGPCNPEIKTCL